MHFGTCATRWPRRAALRRATPCLAAFCLTTLCLAAGTAPLRAQQPTPVPDGTLPELSPETSAAAEHLQSESVSRDSADAVYLHVLDRLTYGARPGDLAHMRSIGLRAWFGEQFNPWHIDDHELERRLQQFPALSLSLSDLMEEYPTSSQAKADMRGRGEPPHGAAARAIYAATRDRADGRDDRTVDISAETLLAMPPGERFKQLCRIPPRQLNAMRSDMSAADAQRLYDGLTAAQVETLAAIAGPRNMVAAETVQSTLLRDIYSERQLEQVMVDFWLNHFSVFINKSQQGPYYTAVYARDAIRPFAMGRFVDLLGASAFSPAMLNYLDNTESIGPHSRAASDRRHDKGAAPTGLNENYARELMELHTLGVDGGYTQADVTEVARVFTGWRVDKRPHGGQPMTGYFDANRHEPGDKHVLGHVIRSGGPNEAIAVLKLLAASPQCAHFIARKLALRFVSDTPADATVDAIAAAFLASGGDVRRTLLAMIKTPEFSAPANFRSKLKNPQQYVVSAVRATGANVESTAALATVVSQLGMPLFGKQTPDGYPAQSSAWQSSAALIARLNFALALTSNNIAGVTTDIPALLAPGAARWSPADQTTALEKLLLHVPADQRTRNLILSRAEQPVSTQASDLGTIKPVRGERDPFAHRAGMKAPSPPANPVAAQAAGLLLGSPEFQRF